LRFRKRGREGRWSDVHVQALQLFSSCLPTVISPVYPIHDPLLSPLSSCSAGLQLRYPEFGRALESVLLLLISLNSELRWIRKRRAERNELDVPRLTFLSLWKDT